MKLTRIKLGIITLTTLTVLGGGFGVYALTETHKQQSFAVTSASRPEPTATVHPQPTAEPVADSPSTPLAAPSAEATQPATVTPAPAPVRSFEEIVKDYPNMSTGAPGYPECAGYLKNAWPEKFQDSNREENIKWVSERFGNVCGAIDMKTTRDEMRSLQFYWGR